MALLIFLVGLVLTQINKFLVIPLIDAHRVDTLCHCASLFRREFALCCLVLLFLVVVARIGVLLLLLVLHLLFPWAAPFLRH